MVKLQLEHQAMASKLMQKIFFDILTKKKENCEEQIKTDKTKQTIKNTIYVLH